MSDPQSASFIPKQNPVKARHRIVSKQIYLLSILSYVLISISLVASAGIFFYQYQTDKVLASEKKDLNEAIAKFKQDDMDSVIALDERLQAIETLVADNLSFRTVLKIIEDSTIDTIRFLGATIKRDDTNKITLEADIETDSFDSVLFQRGIYEQATAIGSIEVEDVQIALAPSGADGSTVANTPRISLAAVFSVDPGTIPYVPSSTDEVAPPTIVPVVPAAATSSVPATGQAVTPAAARTPANTVVPTPTVTPTTGAVPPPTNPVPPAVPSGPPVPSGI